MSQSVTTQEVEFWKAVAEDLGIDIVAPFEVTFSDGNRLCVNAVVKDFGPPHGMLIAFDYNALKPYVQRVIENGYGYSAQLGNSAAGYNRSAMIEILKDWGWSGAKDKRPSWLDCS
jgi:hypothetical protein